MAEKWCLEYGVLTEAQVYHILNVRLVPSPNNIQRKMTSLKLKLELLTIVLPRYLIKTFILIKVIFGVLDAFFMK